MTEKIAWFKEGHLLKLDNKEGFRFCVFKVHKEKRTKGEVNISEASWIDVNEYEARQIAYALLEHTRKFKEMRM